MLWPICCARPPPAGRSACLGRAAGCATRGGSAGVRVLIVLGMGKLGARELNYSSDIDLIVLYDPAAAYHEEEAGPIFVRLVRDLVRLLEERTADGYVFRTDLRLRPDPGATPPAVSLPAAIAYYESMGQNWERAAMSKARPIAGDRAAGEAFLADIRPFVWRRHLDFAMVSDIAAVRRQIHAAKAGRGAHTEPAPARAGCEARPWRHAARSNSSPRCCNSSGAGAIPALRDPTTLGALAGLAAAGRLDRRAAADLADAYNLLRMVEHRLQMIEDRQTHRLPEDAAGMARLASLPRLRLGRWRSPRRSRPIWRVWPSITPCCSTACRRPNPPPPQRCPSPGRRIRPRPLPPCAPWASPMPRPRP